MADVDTLIARVARKVARITGDPLQEDSDVTDALNQALHDIETEYPSGWPWLTVDTTFATVADQADYTPPADWVKTRALYLRNDAGLDEEELLRLSFPELRELNPTLSSGRPSAWAVDHGAIVLRPIPSDVATIGHSYIRSETDLLSGGSGDQLSPQLPSIYWPTLISKATAHLLRDAQNYDAADHHEDQYLSGRQRMFNYAKQFTGPPRTRSGRYFEGG